jgi:hypothetical protein
MAGLCRLPLLENKPFERKIIMTLCDDGHDEVCYDGRNCPVCEELKKISDMEDKIYDLEEQIKDLKERI